MPIDVDDLPSAVLVTDSEERIVQVNPELCRITGLEVTELIGATFDKVLTSGARIFFQTHVWPMLRQNGAIKEFFFHLRNRAGDRVPVYVNAKRVNKPDRVRFVWLFFDAEERRHFEAELIETRQRAERAVEQMRDAHERLRIMHQQLQDQVSETVQEKRSLEAMVQTDSLTLLGNRRSLQQAAQRLGDGGESRPCFSVLMVDIDHFKTVNDTYGHDRGDAVLKDVASCIQSVLRQGDTAVRYGGEEFSVVLPDADAEQALRVAERIHASIASNRPGDLDLTVSIGLASSVDGLDDLYNVLKSADEALYVAKRQGRNQSVHQKDLPPPLRPT